MILSVQWMQKKGWQSRRGPEYGVQTGLFYQKITEDDGHFVRVFSVTYLGVKCQIKLVPEPGHDKDTYRTVKDALSHCIVKDALPDKPFSTQFEINPNDNKTYHKIHVLAEGCAGAGDAKDLEKYVDKNYPRQLQGQSSLPLFSEFLPKVKSYWAEQSAEALLWYGGCALGLFFLFSLSLVTIQYLPALIFFAFSTERLLIAPSVTALCRYYDAKDNRLNAIACTAEGLGPGNELNNYLGETLPEKAEEVVLRERRNMGSVDV